MIEKTKDKKRDTDEPFLRLMGIGGAAVLKLLGVDADKAERYRFRSVVMKDKRLEPDIEGVPIFEGEGRRVFVEFQGYTDNFIRYRLIAKVMMACALERYQGRVLAVIVYTDKAWRDAALSITAFEEGGGCTLAQCFSEVVLTEYSEAQLTAIDPRLVVLAPFTVSRKEGKKGVAFPGA